MTLTLHGDLPARLLVTHTLATRVAIETIANLAPLCTGPTHDGSVNELTLEMDFSHSRPPIGSLPAHLYVNLIHFAHRSQTSSPPATSTCSSIS